MARLTEYIQEKVADAFWQCILSASCYEASPMKTQPQVRHTEKTFTPPFPGYHAQKERNRTRMNACNPLPSMVGMITRVGMGGFQFLEMTGHGGVMQGCTVMRGRFSVMHLQQLREKTIRIHISRHPGRVPILASITTLSDASIENLERSGLL